MKQKRPKCPQCKTSMKYMSFMSNVNGEAEWDGDFYCTKCEGYTITQKLQKLSGVKIL